ncbi:hypothetical protein J43TS3_22940 [Ornithinibacillus bavariensis]|uniref:Uncharacterized protein n=1 Tax=Ornithinibacillus bavariensis TaxID=545502 RepID=A0A919XA61_9BACI|nr:hypothetical protein J43TS3_22940 [Ornithinibacillus bavariensis]
MERFFPYISFFNQLLFELYYEGLHIKYIEVSYATVNEYRIGVGEGDFIGDYWTISGFGN